MTGHEMWDELAVGHALDALEPEDEQTFLRHLRGCDLCARTLDQMRAVGAQLGHAAEPAEPPPALREAIMAGIRESERPPIDVPDAVTRLAGRPASGRRRRTEAGAGSTRGGPATWTWLRVAAAVVAVVALATWNVLLRADNSVKSTAIATRNEFLRELTHPDATRVLLRGNDGAAATVVLRDGHVAMSEQGLEPTTAADTYVLWWADSTSSMKAVGAMEVSGGDLNVFVGIPASIDPKALRAFAISRENGKKPPLSPSAPLLLGEVSA
jgi:hypothetical protein